MRNINFIKIIEFESYFKYAWYYIYNDWLHIDKMNLLQKNPAIGIRLWVSAIDKIIEFITRL